MTAVNTICRQSLLLSSHVTCADFDVPDMNLICQNKIYNLSHINRIPS